MDGTAEEHLRIGALEDAGDAGARRHSTYQHNGVQMVRGDAARKKGIPLAQNSSRIFFTLFKSCGGEGVLGVS